MTRHVMSRSAALAAGLPSSWVAAIRVLFLAGGPAAVPRLVVAARVDAVDGVVLAGSLAHVGEEIHEVAPPVTDDDSARAVTGVGSVTWGVAPSMHGRPCGVGNGLRKTVLVGRRAFSRVFGELGARLGAMAAGETGRTKLELTTVAHCVLIARATRRALQSLPVRGRERSALEAGADVCASLGGHLVASARASRRARGSGLGMTPASAVRRAFWHTQMISHRPVYFCNWGHV